MDTTSQLESRVERNCLMGQGIKTPPMLSLTPTIHMERAESSLMRIFKVVSIQRNFFNHTRSAGAPYLNSNVFLSIYKLSAADNAKSHSVLPRTGAAYKQVFNTWGCQNSGFLSPLSDNPDKILTMLRQVLMEQTILTNEASRSANLGRIINYKIWNFIFYPSTLNLIVNKKQKE